MKLQLCILYGQRNASYDPPKLLLYLAHARETIPKSKADLTMLLV